MKQNSDKIKRQLIEKLKIFSDEDDFIVGVISNAYHDDDRLAMIEYIDKGENVNYEQLVLLSLWLGQERDRKER